MLEDLGCRYALIGHSERRQLFGERDAAVAAKAERLQGSSVRPILCVGETLGEREQDRTLDIVRTQLGAVLDQASGLGEELIVAYEPVWAIGTGKTATPELAQAVHAALRETPAWTPSPSLTSCSRAFPKRPEPRDPAAPAELAEPFSADPIPRLEPSWRPSSTPCISSSASC